MKRILRVMLLTVSALALALSIQSGRSYRASANNADPTGSWFGNALPNDPANSPFPEVVMMPTFFADGNLIANDSHELANPHVTAHGNWVFIGDRRVKATFVWINVVPYSVSANGAFGSFKVFLEGEVDADNPDRMVGTLHAYFFPPGADPLNTRNEGGIDVGIFTIQNLRRIRAH